MGVNNNINREIVVTSELSHLSKTWKWFVLVGLALVVIGIVAIVAPFVASLVLSLFVGILLLVGGGLLVVQGLTARQWSGFLLGWLSSLAMLIIGVMLIIRPTWGALTLAFMLALLFTIDGVLSTLNAIRVKPVKGWGWMLLNGLVALVLAVLLWIGWPEASPIIIGVFLGVYFLVAGLAMVFLGAAAKRAVAHG